MKDKLVGLFGNAGLIIFQIFAILLLLLPVYMCRFPWWLSIILIAVIYFTNYIGSIVTIFVMVWSFITVISGPIGIIEIIYFIVFGLYLIFFFIPAISSIIKTTFSKN